jgi:putative SOS response-associated peptidase YedK
MSRLHCFMASAAEIAGAFSATYPQDLAVPSQTVEGLLGLAVFDAGRGRTLRTMRWGFPRIGRGGRAPDEGPDRIGLVADLTNPMWEHVVVEPRYRCIIPITHFANPDGEPGAKTRTWFSVKDQKVAAWAGFCRNTELGPVYAGMTMEANEAVMPTNDRMPVLLEPDEIERWLQGSIEDVIGFQFRAPIAAERMIVEQTNDRWRGEGLPLGGLQSALL